jgi:hypothetical protein
MPMTQHFARPIARKKPLSLTRIEQEAAHFRTGEISLMMVE